MPAAEVLARAADLVTAVGLSRGALWPGAPDGVPYTPGAPVCAIGAVCVIRGARTPAAANTVIAAGDPALEAAQAALAGEDFADIAYASDQAGDWLRRRPTWAAWWGRRQVATMLRRAARIAGGAR